MRKFGLLAEDPRVRSYAELLEQRQDEEGHETATSSTQNVVEKNVLKLYEKTAGPYLMRQKHVDALKKYLYKLEEPYQHLDCSRPWLCYWILHSLQILGERLNDDVYSHITGFLAKCQSPEGGFGGGPGQYPHLASTYAAVTALCIIGTQEAYNVIDRKTLKQFLLSQRNEEGAFSMHTDGEVDLRGAYCALSVAHLTNVSTPEMFKGTETWIAKCQTWEGGFGGCPGMEAHGGYVYCGLASLVLLGKTNMCCVTSLLRWIVNKQMRLEGGFEGRTNKIVDACYSFWQGGSFPLIHGILSMQGKEIYSNYWLFNQEALQEYLLICCQHEDGGFTDQPGNYSDLYHTCYAFCGLSIAQNSIQPVIVGPTPKLETIQPVYNLVLSTATNALKYFNTLPIPD